MFLTKLISGIVLVAAAVILLVLGGPVLAAGLFVISVIGMHELYRAVGTEKNGPNLLTGAAYAGAAALYLLMYLRYDRIMIAVISACLILILAVYVFTWPAYNSEKVMAAMFGLVYAALSLSFIYRIRMMENGQFNVWLVFACSWGSDTFAYCAGMLLGRHKMAPKLSPKKSVEGAVGGVIGAAVLGMVLSFVTYKMTAAPLRLWEYALICAVGALVSMVGDLAASAIKRDHDIKDYGKLIPGHGGILDRFDSVIFTAPAIWLLAVLMIG